MKNIKERLDPGLVEALEATKESGLPLDLDNDLHGGRQIMHQVAISAVETAASIKEIERKEYQISCKNEDYKIPLYLYRPVGDTKMLPVIYWTHGGGLITGEVKQDEYLLKSFSKSFNCVVVAVAYRLAPEHRFPTALEDCYLGLQWVFDSATELNIDQKRIAIAGASAGGGLTAALAQLVRDRNEFEYPLIYQLLMYPMLDDRNIHPASDDAEDTFIWTRANNLFGWSAYLGQQPGTENTPVYASASRMGNLEKLPPAMILVGGIDLFVSESITYARRLNDAGVPTELHVYPGGIHGYETLAPDIRISQGFTAALYSGLKNALKK
ncbi:alpha/beta hydrolase [Fulvivirgaceae bacterium BMA12]|uniref:Alpha/beta hydrolase n=1 Tax=Agaribacillus aureus TaxID=3051825 RepID=A0ABT8KYD9_9BACT|nr:alpha/beta hydrolase [Fulvivirgaceae bacterium BMA12]